MQKKWFCSLVLCFSLSALWAQQKPLPDFFVHRGTKNSVAVSWANNFGDECIQLNIQRSYDSLTNFKTIFSTPAPQLPTNGYTDRNAPEGRAFYRIFYMLNGGAYYFTVAKKPGDASTFVLKDTAGNTGRSAMANPVAAGTSMVSKNKTGNIVVQLKTPDVYNYSMKVYNLEGDRVLFSISRFADDVLILDRGNFLRKGHYKFRIFYNDKELETGYLDID